MTITVGIVMGSASDRPVMQHAADTLTGLGVESETRVLSAHRTPEQAAAFVREATAKGTKVFICGAGGAAHLAGAVAAQTARPVIGIPVAAGSLGGLDSLLSTVDSHEVVEAKSSKLRILEVLWNLRGYAKNRRYIETIPSFGQ